MAPNQTGHKPAGMSDKTYDKLHKFAAEKNLKYQHKVSEQKKDKPA